MPLYRGRDSMPSCHFSARLLIQHQYNPGHSIMLMTTQAMAYCSWLLSLPYFSTHDKGELATVGSVFICWLLGCYKDPLYNIENVTPKYKELVLLSLALRKRKSPLEHSVTNGSFCSPSLILWRSSICFDSQHQQPSHQQEKWCLGCLVSACCHFPSHDHYSCLHRTLHTTASASDTAGAKQNKAKEVKRWKDKFCH